jgi:hypothetical protein
MSAFEADVAKSFAYTPACLGMKLLIAVAVPVAFALIAFCLVE